LKRNGFSAITNLDNKKVITSFPLTNTISAEFFVAAVKKDNQPVSPAKIG
jgi:hypothetical protein